MKRLVKLAKALDRKEIRLLHQMYKSAGEDPKRKKLFELARKGDALSDRLAVQQVYNGKGSVSAFKKLKTRLRNDLYNILLVSSNDTGQLNAKNSIENHRAILQSKIIKSRGIKAESYELLIKAKNQSIRDEMYFEKLQIMDLLVDEWLYTSELAEESIDEIGQAVEELNNYCRAKKLYSKVALARVKCSEEVDELGWEMSLEEVRRSFERSHKAKIGCLYRKTAILLNDFQENYSTAYFHADKLYELVSKNGTLSSPSNVYAAIILKSMTLFKMGEKGQANDLILTLNAESAISVLHNDVLMLELLFFCFIRSNNWIGGEKVVHHVIHSLGLDRESAVNIKWQFFRASCLFHNGKYESAHEKMKMLIKLKRKGPLKYNIMMLYIMTSVECKDVERLIVNSESTQKTLSRYSKHLSSQCPRREAILKLLKSLDKCCFNVEAILKNEKESVKMIKSNASQLSWDPMGAEIIRFDKWLESAKDKTKAIA